MLAQLQSKHLIDATNLKVMGFIEASLSENTRSSYHYDILSFFRWGGTLPTDAQTIIRYLADNAQNLNSRTLDRRLKTIRYWHRLHKVADPTEDCEVKQVMKGIKRSEGRPAQKAMPITKEDLALIDSALTGPEPKLIDYRDNALIQVGFFGAFRRSELVGINIEHLKFTKHGMEIFIPRSKTDQYSDGAKCVIPKFKNGPCPVKTLMNWIAVANIESGPVFRSLSINKKQHVCDHALDPKVVNLIIKKLISRCEIGDPDDYSGHSLRRGFATSVTRQGSSLEALMRHGRWKNASTVIGYIEESARFSDNPASLLDF